MAPIGSESRETTQVTVVGGGIAGLYAAYLLAHDPRYSVELLDLARERLGGRITTRVITVGDVEFRAEFGPMRFEIDLQSRFRRLCQHLGIGFTRFAATGSPNILTQYEMTDVECSFESVAELHEWAVLKMFFNKETGKASSRLPESSDVEAALQHIEEAHTRDGNRHLIGRDQLLWLQCYLDDRLFLGPGDGQWIPLPCEEMEHRLDFLRVEHHLQGYSGNPLLRDVGLWHALSDPIPRVSG
jgi:monoamine oxidase